MSNEIDAGVVTLTINGESIEAVKGSSVLETCRAAGVHIPTLCYDPRLEAYGGCRLCIVEIEGMRGYPTSCTTKVAEGMVVRTESPELTRLRRTVVELLVSDHPLDCMTCESCGSCELQKVAYELQVTSTPYSGERHHRELPPDTGLVARDPDKCIACGRCVRICREVQGVNVWDWVGRGFEVVASTPFDRPLAATDCEFCGQCISTCPVGALYERDRRFTARPWEREKTETVCAFCGVGCTIELESKGEKIVGVSAPQDRGVNKGNLCVKGRFGYHFVNHPDRLTQPLVRRDGVLEPATWAEAFSAAASGLMRVRDTFGPDAVGGLASAKCTNEENFLFQKFMRVAIGTNNVDHCARL